MDNRIRITSLMAAEKVAGQLVNTSKMPCKSWGISNEHCKTGQELAKIPGTVCSQCYAKRGPIAWPHSRRRQAERLAGLERPEWVNAMVALISIEGNMFFRWFDSGDLQNAKHLEQIIQIARLIPDIKFWLPTQERKLVKEVTEECFVPDNLTIRVTNTYIDDNMLSTEFKYSASVMRCKKKEWYSYYILNDQLIFYCPADMNISNGACGACRACWDKDIKHVVYRKK